MLRKSISSREKSSNLANHEIVTIALLLCGGDARSIDTEDIAVKANEIAPGRFAWRKYPDQINIDTVRKRRWDARKDTKGRFVFGSEKETLKGGYPAARSSLRERRFARAEKLRMLETEAYAKFSSGSQLSITPR